MINRILKVCLLALIVTVDVGKLEPLIGIRQLCRTTMEVTCSMSNKNSGIWTLYRAQKGSENKQNMAKIDDSKNKCQVSAFISTTHCICVETTNVICNISDDMIAIPGDLWQCGVFVRPLTLLSNTTVQPSFEIKNIEECTTTHVPQHVTEGSITSFTTRAFGVTEDTEAVLNEVEENVTIESFKVTTIQHTNNVEENEREGSHNKPDITQIALMIAGPVVVFDIGLIAFIYRNKLKSCFGGKHIAKQMSTNENASGDENINMAAEFNNGSCSNCNSTQRERVTTRQPTAVPHVKQIRKLNANQQADVDFDESIDNDLLYSRVKGKATMCADINTNPQSDKTQGRDDLSFAIPLDEDTLYSSVKDNKNIEAGACGYTLQGKECTPADPVYIDIDNTDAHYANAKKYGPPGNKQHRENPLFTTGNNLTTFVNDDLLDSKSMNDIRHKTSNNPLYSVEINAISYCGSNSSNNEDPVYSVVNKDNGIYSLAKNVDPLYSTVRKKKQICVPEPSGVSFKDDPLYSVVDKTNRGTENDWNTTVPTAPICSISAMPLYSKVKKKKKNVVDTGATTDNNS